MLKQQFKLEIRRHYLIFLIFTLVSMALHIYDLFQAKDGVFPLSFLSDVVIGILVPIYIFKSLYDEFYVGKTGVNHTVPTRTSSFFTIKALVFILGAILVWLPSLIDTFANSDGLYVMRIAESSNAVLGSTYVILSKLASVIGGVMLIGAAIAVAKLIRNSTVSHLLLAFILIGIVVIQFAIIVDGSGHWAIGTTSLDAYEQYANMLVVMPFIQDQPYVDINETLSWTSIMMNVVVALGGGVIASLLFNSNKYEIYGK